MAEPPLGIQSTRWMSQVSFKPPIHFVCACCLNSSLCSHTSPPKKGPGRNKAPPLKDWWNTVTMASGGRDSLLGGGRGLKAWLGLDDSSYDWAWLCKPRSPWSPPGPPPPFFGNEEQLPL